MSEKTREKIEKHFGWDFCDHDRIRRFCPECKLAVPALWRKEDKIFFPEIKRQTELNFKR
jgi:hypothetical protein